MYVSTYVHIHTYIQKNFYFSHFRLEKKLRSLAIYGTSRNNGFRSELFNYFLDFFHVVQRIIPIEIHFNIFHDMDPDSFSLTLLNNIYMYIFISLQVQKRSINI